MMEDLINGKSKYSNIFNYPAFTWADSTIISHGWLMPVPLLTNWLIPKEAMALTAGPWNVFVLRNLST